MPSAPPSICRTSARTTNGTFFEIAYETKAFAAGAI